MKGRFLSFLIMSSMFLLGVPTLDAQTTVTFPLGGGAVPVNIPDNAAGGVTRTFTVSGIPAGVTINSVAINLNMSHTWVGDLRSTLTSPDAEVHTLFYDIGDTNSPVNNGDSSNLSGNYRLVDSAATTLWTGALGGTSAFTIPPGDYRTTSINVNTATNMNATFGYPGVPFAENLMGEKSGKTMSDIPSELTNGTWTLVISDNAVGDTGPISVGTQLEITYTTVTAANASIRGQLVTSTGRGVMNAWVNLTNLNSGETQSVRSTSFGYFSFEDLPTGNTYVIQVVSQRFQFPTQTFQLDDNVLDMVIQANP